MNIVFAAEGVSFRYPHRDARAVDGVDVHARAGEIVALLGPNGSGKSTLLRLLAGALRPDAGTVRYLDRSIADWPRDELARSVGVVTQAEEIAFPVSVRDLVSMGRYPHLGAWRREGESDRAAVEQAMDLCGVTALADRSMLEISGGEKQRARVARALAQQPRTLLLDEPGAALDIAHEMALLELLDALRGSGVTVIMATHNINYAARYADRLVLLHRGRVAASGEPSKVITRDIVERVYDWPVLVRLEDGAPQIVPLRSHGTIHATLHLNGGTS